MIYQENLKNANIDISSSGDNTIIAVPTQGYIAIDHINFLPESAVNVILKDGSTPISGTYKLDAKQAYTIENAIGNEHGIIKCLPGNAFILNLSGAVYLGGFIKYRIVGE